MAGFGDAIRRHPVLLIVVLIAIGVGVYLLVNAIVVTDEERVKALIEDGKKAVIAGDVDGVMEIVDPTFATDRYTLNSLRQQVDAYLTDYSVQTISILKDDIDIRGDVAQVYLSGVARMTWLPQSVEAGGSFEYNMTFRKRGKEWKLTAISGTEL